jgi:hypothetical protein
MSRLRNRGPKLRKRLQRDYFKGEGGPEKGPMRHRTKLRLKPFIPQVRLCPDQGIGHVLIFTSRAGDGRMSSLHV